MKKYTFLRYFSYWLYVLVSIAVPVGLIAWQFDLFKKPGPLQITGYGIIAIIIVVFVFKGMLKRAVADMEKTWVRTVIQNILRLFPIVAFWLVLMFLESYIAKIRFILFFVIIGYVAAAFIDVWHTNLVNKCKTEKAKNEDTQT